MNQDDPDLMTWHPFHVSHWPRSILDPEAYDGGEKLQLSWDLGTVEDKKPIIRRWCVALPELQRVRWLSIWSHTTQPLFDAACQMHNLECLQIKWSNIKTLDAITGLSSLRYLSMGSSTKLESIQALAKLRNLQLLELENFKLITDFSPLAAMINLESLAITGSMWSRQTVASLEPFVRMTHLKSLAIDTSHIPSIRPLAALTNPKQLGIGGRMPMEEYAWLAGKLPHTACRWFTPYLDLAGCGYSPCKKCQRDSMVMLTGRGKKTVCKFCDHTKVRHQEAEFYGIKHAAMADQA